MIFSDFLKETINKHGFTAKDVVFTINSKHSFVREIAMPFMTKEEYKQAVLWDSIQYVPYEAESYYLDYALNGEPDATTGQQPILLVATPKEIVDGYIAVAEACELNVLQITVDMLALNAILEKQVNDFLLLDAGMNYSTLAIFQKGVPVAQREIVGGLVSLSKIVAEKMNISMAEANDKLLKSGILESNDVEVQPIKESMIAEIEEVARECRRTSDYYVLNNKEANFTHLVVTGDGGAIPGVNKHLNEFIDLQVMDLSVNEVVTFHSRFDKKKVEELLSSLTTAIGAALSGGSIND